MNLLLQASLLLSIASSALGQNEGSWDFDNANFCSTRRDENEGQDSFCNTKLSIDYRLISLLVSYIYALRYDHFRRVVS